MLEFYDFITYSFFAIQIGHTFFVVPITAYLIEIAPIEHRALVVA
jgi:hypothetical protein